MKVSNISYDRMKWFALVFIPALEFLILTLGDIWGFAHYIEIGQTIAALGVFLAALLGVSSKSYYKELGESSAEDPDEDDSEEVR